MVFRRKPNGNFVINSSPVNECVCKLFLTPIKLLPIGPHVAFYINWSNIYFYINECNLSTKSISDTLCFFWFLWNNQMCFQPWCFEKHPIVGNVCIRYYFIESEWHYMATYILVIVSPEKSFDPELLSPQFNRHRYCRRLLLAIHLQ